ncbi:MAG: YARHG domain-containing protein [Cyclobacteriaceae bacterium]|jgi:hypothetical protein
MTRFVLFFLVSVLQVGYGQSVTGDYPQASQRLLTQADVCELDGEKLKIMRNEIFARYGYIFKSPDLQQHFQQQAWYQPTSTDVTARLTDVEKTNINLIRRQEELDKFGTEFESFFEVFGMAVQTSKLSQLSNMTWYGDFFANEDELKASWANHGREVREAISDTAPLRVSEVEYRLAFGPWHSGVQYKMVIFQKRGRCWYLHSIMMVG